VFLIRPTGFAGLTLTGVIDGFRKFPKRTLERLKGFATWMKGLWKKLVASRG